MTKCHIINGVIGMPTKTYWNLPEGKKEKLIAAAKKEFGRVLLKDASINRIIKDANISRGSFYMYFSDKDDLYAYLLSQYRINGLQMLLECLHRSKGDIIEAYKDLYTIFLEKCFNTKEKNFFQNIFLNTNLYIENKAKFFSLVIPEDDKLFYELSLVIDMKKLSKNAQENICDVVILLFDITMKNIIPVILMDSDKEEAYHHFIKSLQLIEGGIYK